MGRIQTEETKQKISKSLQKRYYTIPIICKSCINILLKGNKSGYCKEHVYQTDWYKNKLRHPKKDSSKMGGLRDGGGKTKVFLYKNFKLNKDEIRVAKILDNLKLDWTRNFKGFEYTTFNGLKRKYYPDFYIKDYDIYVEYKGWVTKEIIHKMNDARKRNNFKLIIIYSDDKRYKNLGLNISEIEKNNLIFAQMFQG